MKWRALFLLLWLMGVGTAVFAYRSPALGVEQLIINEVDYDQPGLQDAEEFIEITNIGEPTVDLVNYQIGLVDGDTGIVYASIPLNAVSLPPNGYYVLCRDPLVVPNCNQVFTGPIQNGAPDAVALLFGGAVLVDTVSYEGDTTAPYTEGSGVGLEDDGTAVMQGIARWGDQPDTNQNNIDFSPRCATPGLPNVEQSSDCASLFAPEIAVMLTALPGSLPEPGGTVTLTIRIDNNGPLPVTLETLTDNSAQNLNGQGSCQTSQEIVTGGNYTCQYETAIAGVEGDLVMRAVTATAVDFFSNSATDTGQTTISVTRRLSWELYLPVLLHPRPYGEPNNTCTEAFAIPLNQTLAFLAEDAHDWYRFDWPQQGTVRIHWQNFVAQAGQMLLYRGDCEKLEFVANNGETAVNRTLVADAQPPGRYYIWIISDAPPNDQDEYTLRVQFP
ncbi:MAG: lamin tail domain-containing protein [Anaerolineae bacterium]|nr:lamin tail domain-containing protein [Anaerolineae bacterium]